MANVLLRAVSAKPGASPVTLVDGGTDTGYRLIAQDWGNAVWETSWSGPRGTQGARAAGGTPLNRPVVMGLRVNAATQDALQAALSVLYETFNEDMRRYGGTLTWRAQGQTYRQHFDVLSGSAQIREYGRAFSFGYWVDVLVELVCAPYLLGDPMDVDDDFSEDRLSEYTFDAGAVGNVAVASGQLDAVANLTSENRLVHSEYGYTYGDHQATVKFTPGATITSFKAGVPLKRVDALDYIEVYVDDNGTNSRLRIDVVTAGSRVNRASTNLAARVSNGTAGWVRGRVEGNVLIAEYFTSAPTPMGTPTLTNTYTLAGAEITAFGLAVEGRAGISWTPQHTDAKLDDFQLWAFVYYSKTLPAVL